MARIRTIKPSHWADKALSTLPLGAHLLWIGSWNFSDDEGIFENDPLLIRSNIFPRRTDIRTEQITQWLDQLQQARFIIPFTHNGESYYIHRTFKTHQKIDKPQPSKIPEEVIRGLFDECSENVRPCIVKEGNVEEGNFPPADKPPVPKNSKKISIKKIEEPEPYWQSLVDTWFSFNVKKFGGQPSFKGKDPRELKKLIGLLKARANLKQIVWTEENALIRFNAFLVEAYVDPWLSTHFLLSNLVNQFDKVILNHSQNGTRKQNPPGAVIPNVGGKSAGAVELVGMLKAELTSSQHTGG